MKIGDKVRVVRWQPGTPESTAGKTFTIKRDDGQPKYGLDVPGATGAHDLWWYNADDLELVSDRKCAAILTEKVLVGAVPCRKILGFEGILGRDELPKKYLEGEPSFYQEKTSASHYEFDGRVRWISIDGETIGVTYRLPSAPYPKIVLDACPVHMLTIGDVYSDVTFHGILVWLKRAGSRLAKIRKQEKAAWSGKETIEI